MKSKEVLVSIGLPVYNGEGTIEKTIKSLLLQDYSNFEIVISDNGSTDATPRIVQELAQQYPNVAYYRSDQNHGLVWNFNRVFELSRGEYFMWASHDDEHTSNYISRCLEELKKYPEAALCAPRTVATWGNEKSNIWVSKLNKFEDTKEPVSRYLETLRNFPAVALYGLYRSSYIKRTKLIPKVIGGDLLFIQNLSMYGDIIGLDEILFIYHQREKWNSVDQDYFVFLGKRPKPRWYSPFLFTYFCQVKIIFTASLAISLKTKLLFTLIRFQSMKIVQKVLLKLIKLLVPGANKVNLARSFYWRYLHSSSIEVLDGVKFEERIVKPTLQLN